MSTTSNSNKQPADAQSALDSIKDGASGLASSVTEKIQAIKDIFKTVAATNETFRKTVEANQSVTKDFVSAVTEAVKAAETAEERERLLKMAQETVHKATDFESDANGKAFDLATGTIVVLSVIAAGTAAIVYAREKMK